MRSGSRERGLCPTCRHQARSSWSRTIPRGGTRSWAWFSRSSCTKGASITCPIDVNGLTQYPFLERLGFFGVEVGTTRGSLAFLRQSQAILSRPESVLWITPQGEFVDPRERPVCLKPGIGHLAYRQSAATIVPMALEYPFWNDRCPEALARFGEPITITARRSETPQVWTTRIEQAMEKTQDQLAEEARRRDPAAFLTVIGGTSGVGGVYDTWRRLRSAFRGESFHPEHRIAKGPPPGLDRLTQGG